jgi:SOS response regulatory protein OraA/RecX
MDIQNITFTLSGNEASIRTDSGYFSITRADLAVFLKKYAELKTNLCNSSASKDFSDILPLYVDVEGERELTFFDEKLKAIKYAVYLLNISDKSEKQLCLKLKLKNYCPRACIETVEVLKKNGFISDERFCRRKCEQLSENKLFGRRRITTELMSKGLSYDLCNRIIDESEIDFEKSLRLLFDKISKGIIPETREQKKKISDKLLRYGYSYDEISRLFEEIDAEL